MAALPTDPAPTRPWTSPVAATVTLVTGSDRAGRWANIQRAIIRIWAGIREAGLIVCAVAAFVYGAFQIHEVAGWAALTVGLLLLDWSRRDHTPPDSGSP